LFVTNATYTGNLGGLSAGDSICQASADGAGLTGTFKAWLSDTSTTAGSRFTHPTLPYILRDGTLIANDWTDLTDGSIAHAIDLDENGAAAPGAPTGACDKPRGEIHAAGCGIRESSELTAGESLFVLGMLRLLPMGR
jgi:hypothetical protein